MMTKHWRGIKLISTFYIALLVRHNLFVTHIFLNYYVHYFIEEKIGFSIYSMVEYHKGQL